MEEQARKNLDKRALGGVLIGTSWEGLEIACSIFCKRKSSALVEEPRDFESRFTGFHSSSDAYLCVTPTGLVAFH